MTENLLISLVSHTNSRRWIYDIDVSARPRSASPYHSGPKFNPGLLFIKSNHARSGLSKLLPRIVSASATVMGVSLFTLLQAFDWICLSMLATVFYKPVFLRTDMHILLMTLKRGVQIIIQMTNTASSCGGTVGTYRRICIPMNALQ